MWIFARRRKLKPTQLQEEQDAGCHAGWVPQAHINTPPAEADKMEANQVRPDYLGVTRSLQQITQRIQSISHGGGGGHVTIKVQK